MIARPLSRRALLSGAEDGVYDARYHPGQAADGEPRPERAGYRWVNTGLAGFAKWVQVPASSDPTWANGAAESFRVKKPWHVMAAEESDKPLLEQVGNAFDVTDLPRDVGRLVAGAAEGATSLVTDAVGGAIRGVFGNVPPAVLWGGGALVLLLLFSRK